MSLLCIGDRGHVNELQGENVRLGEEAGFMNGRMDELTQELQSVRMGAARAEAAAVTAAALTARQSIKPEEAEEEKVCFMGEMCAAGNLKGDNGTDCHHQEH